VGEGEAVPTVQAGAEAECRCAEETVAAAEAALGAGQDEASQGEVGQAVVRNRSLAVRQGFSSLRANNASLLLAMKLVTPRRLLQTNSLA